MTGARDLRRGLDSLYGGARRRLERVWLERRVGFPPAASEAIPLEELGHAKEGRERYGPSPYGILGRALRRSEVGPEDVFLDIGCGMGRVVYEAAARYRFKRVIGIDVVPEFTAVARQVIARTSGRLRCRNVEVRTADAAEYAVPDDVTIAYFGASLGPPILGVVADKLAASADARPRVVRVISYSPTREPPELDEHPRVRLVRRGRRPLRRWRPADNVYLYEIRPLASARPAVSRTAAAAPGRQGTQAGRHR